MRRSSFLAPVVSAVVVATILTFSIATPLHADDFTLVPDKFVYCTTCHGVELNGNASVDAPRLNGMESWYVRNQLKAFKNGWRGTHPEDLIGMEMQPQAALLSDDEIDDAVAFVGAVQRRPNRATPTVSGDVARGETFYRTCAACHGTSAEGNRRLNAPRLAGQSDWYLLRQLEKYASGVRGSSAADTYGAQMRASMAVLPDEAAMADVVAYINSLR